MTQSKLELVLHNSDSCVFCHQELGPTGIPYLKEDMGYLTVMQDMLCEQCNTQRTDVYEIGEFQYCITKIHKS